MIDNLTHAVGSVMQEIIMKLKFRGLLLSLSVFWLSLSPVYSQTIPAAKFDNGYASGLATTTGTVVVNPGNLWNLPQSTSQLFISVIYQSTWNIWTSALGPVDQPIIGTTDAGGVNSFAVEVLPPGLVNNSGTPVMVLYLDNPGLSKATAFAVPNMIRNDGTPHLLQLSLTTDSTETFHLQVTQDRSFYSAIPVNPANLSPLLVTVGTGFRIPLVSSVYGVYHWWVGQNVIPESENGGTYTYTPLVKEINPTIANIAPWVYTYKGLLSQIYVWPQTPVNLATLIVNDTFQKPLPNVNITQGTFVNLPATGANVLYNGQVAPSVYLNSVGQSTDLVTGQVTNYLINNGDYQGTGDPNFYTPQDQGYMTIESIDIDNN